MAYVPEWGQSPWSSTLRQTKQRTPYNAWGEASPIYGKKPYYEEDQPSRAEHVAAAASERLYGNRRHYSDTTKRWRTGTQCRRPKSARHRSKKPTRAAPAAPAPGLSSRDAPTSSRPLSREEPEVWAENVTQRRPRPRSAPAAAKPQLTKQKQRDYGTGIPNWSPYNNSKADCLQRTTANGEYGEFTKHHYLKSLATLLAEHGRKSGADMKMLLDPSSAMHCAVAEYKEYKA